MEGPSTRNEQQSQYLSEFCGLCSKVHLYYIPWSSNISLYGDILLAYPDAITVAKIYADLADHTNRVGLQIAPKRVQKMEPWKYLGYIIIQRHI